MRGIIAGAILVSILSLLLVISYIFPAPPHGPRVEMIGKSNNFQRDKFK